jgi:hypothetical protein
VRERNFDDPPAGLAGDGDSWSPASLLQVVELFAGVPFRWWIGGGIALELFAGRSWREHHDCDVGICRADAQDLYRWLARYELWVASGGQRSRWTGQPLSQERAENNVWVRPTAESPWLLDVTLGDGDGERWRYRRDPRLSLPWSEAVRQTEQGIPYLAPEVQLLFKSKDVRDRDEEDAKQVIPMLSAAARAWLRANLPSDHRWQSI